MDTRTSLARALDAARRVVAVTGAGISAPSGLQTYRTAGSAWDDPALERKLHVTRYGNHLPELWVFFDDLRAQMQVADPNTAHFALTDLQSRLRERGGDLTVLTQNVDRLHTRAGTHDVIELHGSVAVRCLRRSCRAGAQEQAGRRDPDGVPRCPECGRRQRLDAVLFGERLPSRLLRVARRAAIDADVVLYVGTSGTVEPVASLQDHTRGITALVDPTPWGHFDIVVPEDAAVALPAVVAAGA